MAAFSKSFWTFACDGCLDPLVLNSEDGATENMLLLYRSKELAEIASSEFSTPLPIIKVRVTVEHDGTQLQESKRETPTEA